MLAPSSPEDELFMSVVVLISGRGSNLRSLIEHGLPISAVISNRGDAAGLDIARRASITSLAIEHSRYASRTAFEEELVRRIDELAPSVVVLAGFMRVLGAAFVARYADRLINIHPSLLPAFPGLDTHRRALAAGVKVHGATVHLVTSEVDAGPIVIQAAVPVLPDDDCSALAARVLAQEHVILPRAVGWFVDGAVRIADGHVRIAGDRQQFVFAFP